MIIEKVLGNIDQLSSNKKYISVPFTWFELEKKRISKKAEDGIEFGICVEETLLDGDILCETEAFVYVCEVLPSEVVKIYVKSMQEMGKLCFELGNRHLSLKISEDCVMVPYDNPTYEYLIKLGFDAHILLEKFTAYTECKAHGSSNHSHKHDHDHKH